MSLNSSTPPERNKGLHFPSVITGGAGTLGILISWKIVTAGMLVLVSVYRHVTLRQTDIVEGIYGWSKAGFRYFCRAGSYEDSIVDPVYSTASSILLPATGTSP